MKFKNISLSILALGALALVSCKPGQYWDEPTISDDALAFPSPNEVTLIPAEGTFPSTCTVTVSRSNADTELKVPLLEGTQKTPTAAEQETLGENQILVNVVGETTPVVVDLPAILYTQKSAELSTTQKEVIFAKGSYSATITMDVDTDLVEPGFDYEAAFTLVLPKSVNITVNSSNTKCNFTIRQAVILVWEDAGTAEVTSSYIGNKEPVQVPVQVASNYPDKKFALYRLVSPYHYLNPEVEEGYNIEFICNKGSVRRAYSPAEGWQQTGISMPDKDGIMQYVYLGSVEEYTSSFKNQQKRYVLIETVGLNTLSGANSAQPEDDEDPESETLTFTWNF